MGGKKQTVTQNSSPWSKAQPYLVGAMGQAQNLYNQGAFAPVPYGFGAYASTAPGSTPGAPTATPAAAPGAAPTNAALSTGGGTGLAGSMAQMFPNYREDNDVANTRGGIGSIFGGGLPGTPGASSGGPNYFGNMTPAQLEAAARAAAEMRIPGFGQTTQDAMQGIINRGAAGAPGLDTARSFLTGAMGGGMYEGMQGVRDNILGSAIPAAASMFAGSGLTNSSVAMDGVGRAASEALAPFEYGAYENAQNRAMQAAGMMPGIEQAMYMPDQMRLGMGQLQDQLAQNRATAAQQAYGEAAGLPAANFSPYLNAIMGLGGMGSSGSTTGPKEGTGLGPAVMGGLGTYGALAAIPGISGGMAGLGGILAGLAGLSDRRAKEDIQRIGTTDGGRNLYKYKYRGCDGYHIGVMADENPDAIKGYVNGFAIVDYGRIN